MSTNFRGFLRNLPVNTDLMREFLAEHLLDAKDSVDWSADEITLAAALADAIEAYADTAVRDDLIAALEQVAQLADAAGTRQMLTVCSTEAAIVAAFEALESPEERALWLYVNSAAKFNEAVIARWFDEGLTRDSSQRWTLPACPGLTLSDADQSAIAARVASFFLQRFGYGRNYQPYVVPRHLEGSLLFVIDLSDHASNRAVWVNGSLKRGPLILSRTLVLNYHLETGRTETVSPGGEEAQKVLVDAFTEHGLKKKGTAKKIVRETYRLESLRDGVDIFDREALGLRQPRLKSIAVFEMASGLRSTFDVMGRGNRASADQLLKAAYPTDNPLKRKWLIVGAHIELPFYPEEGHGGTQEKTLRLSFNRKGQANLHKFTQEERNLIEPLLVEWGLVTAPKAAPPVAIEEAPQ
ncbi:MAG TPA: hypothetical protein PK752_00140 [Accumulibacter sp.]|uniref:hypothetical protein n=1 Tax=Accumulibacter sp. TaxID=2053492 RepID=UPI002C741600|nr:hypothetical protein [Accumulibacter sp.]HRD86655.1 hypothetical protein [Accumulibacter sp.]